MYDRAQIRRSNLYVNVEMYIYDPNQSDTARYEPSRLVSVTLALINIYMYVGTLQDTGTTTYSEVPIPTAMHRNRGVLRICGDPRIFRLEGITNSVCYCRLLLVITTLFRLLRLFGARSAVLSAILSTSWHLLIRSCL